MGKEETKKQMEEMIKATKKPVTKGRGGNANFPQVMSGKAEDVMRIGNNLMHWYRLPHAVTDEEILERLDVFFVTCFENGEIPTYEKMSLALGYDTKTLWRWENGEEGSTTTRKKALKKAKSLLASFDAEMVTEGKINPITYIFRAKNFFGMQDKTEYVLTPNNPLGDIQSPEDIQKRLTTDIPED